MKRTAGKSASDGRLLLLVVLGIAAAVGYSLYGSWSRSSSRNELSPPPTTVRDGKVSGRRLEIGRLQPLDIPPDGALGDTVSDDDLRIALEAALPYWDPPAVATMLHALRLWGLDAEFPPDAAGNPVLGGRGMVETLLHNDLCIKRNREWFDEYLVATPYGIRIATSHQAVSGDLLAVTHVDQLLQVLGEAGVSRDAAVQASEGPPGTVTDLLSDSINRFTLAQELEFTTCALARWLPPQRLWVNRFGKEFSFDDLASALLERPHGDGACNGVHANFALVNLLRADEQSPILSAATRRRIETYVRECTMLLEQNELSTGGWDETWSVKQPSESGPDAAYWPRFSRISNTGHHLEWIALAPAELRPSKPVVARAVRAVVNDIEARTERERNNFKTFWPLTHVARALALLRAEQPYAFWNSLPAVPLSE